MFLPYAWLLSRQFAAGRIPQRPFDEFKGEEGVRLLIAYLGGFVAYTALSIVYDTWMVGKFGGTVGKLVLGFRVVNADGSRVGYLKAFGRWAAETLGKFIWFAPISAGYYLGTIQPVTPAAGQPPELPVGSLIALALACVWYLVGGFPYYLAGWTRQKLALHDFMCRTRVVRRESP